MTTSDSAQDRWEHMPGCGLTFPEGFVGAGARGGLKADGPDIALVVADTAAAVAGVFTTNRMQAPCVSYTRGVVKRGAARAIFVNAGNANACNGPRGEEDNRAIAEIVSRSVGAPAEQVCVASTGIIGHVLPMERVTAGIAAAVDELDRGSRSDDALCRAIMTTDTRPKYLAAEVDSPSWNAPARLGAMCKGAGMIAPNMATMLAFITTDARVPAPLLQIALRFAVAESFNAVTIDGDTSTNDMCLLLASGVGGCEISRQGAAFDSFTSALTRIGTELAKQIARDGEGATHLVEVRVSGAPTRDGAVAVARSIAESPLVKTAIFGADPNWGRLMMAAGKAGVPFDPGAISARIGGILVCQSGTSVAFDADDVHARLHEEEILLEVDLGSGEESATMWTCDYSYDYIRINADYHT